MMITGPLDLGAAQILGRNTGEILGYAYTVANGNGQLQRWLLYQHPHNSFDIAPPPQDMAGWTLADWQAHVAGLWRPGSYYVRAQADVYRHGETYQGQVWTQIPPADRLPDPTFPEGGDAYQLDPDIWAMECLQAQSKGLAFANGSLQDSSNVEYWMLPSQFQPAGKGATAAVSPGSLAARSLQEFVDTANRSFGPGCLFVIIGCVNYNGSHVPAAL